MRFPPLLLVLKWISPPCAFTRLYMIESPSPVSPYPFDSVAKGAMPRSVTSKRTPAPISIMEKGRQTSLRMVRILTSLLRPSMASTCFARHPSASLDRSEGQRATPMQQIRMSCRFGLPHPCRRRDQEGFDASLPMFCGPRHIDRFANA